MDPLAHTLVGAALGRAVSDRRIPWAGLLGAIAGNAPDWTEPIVTPPFWTPRSGPAYLLYHRGITHSFAGAAVLIVGLTAVAGLLLRWLAARRGAAPPPWRWIAACVAAGVMSHLYLDWQGSYGVRPLLPWNATWYYADWVAIVDPFFWMLPLIALAWGARRHWAPALAYGFALAGVEALVLWGWRAAVVALWVWLVGVALGGACVIGWVRHWFGVAGRRRATAYAMGALTVYAAANGLASLWAKALAREEAIRRFGPTAEWAALTVVGRPFRWQAICASADTVAGHDWAAPRHLGHPAVRAALATPQGRAVAQFARFLAADVDSSGGLRVVLRDARYHAGGRPGWAAAVVQLR